MNGRVAPRVPAHLRPTIWCIGVSFGAYSLLIVMRVEQPLGDFVNRIQRYLGSGSDVGCRHRSQWEAISHLDKEFWKTGNSWCLLIWFSIYTRWQLVDVPSVRWQNRLRVSVCLSNKIFHQPGNEPVIHQVPDAPKARPSLLGVNLASLLHGRHTIGRSPQAVSIEFCQNWRVTICKQNTKLVMPKSIQFAIRWKYRSMTAWNGWKIKSFNHRDRKEHRD